MSSFKALTVVDNDDPRRDLYRGFVGKILPPRTIHHVDDCRTATRRVLKGKFRPDLIFLTPTRNGRLDEIFFCSIHEHDELRECSFFLLATKLEMDAVEHAHKFDVVPCPTRLESVPFWRWNIARAMVRPSYH